MHQVRTHPQEGDQQTPERVQETPEGEHQGLAVAHFSRSRKSNEGILPPDDWRQDTRCSRPFFEVDKRRQEGCDRQKWQMELISSPMERRMAFFRWK